MPNPPKHALETFARDLHYHCHHSPLSLTNRAAKTLSLLTTPTIHTNQKSTFAVADYHRGDGNTEK